MTQFGANLGAIHRWVVHNIQTGPMGREGEIWGCQVDLEGQPHQGLAVHYAGDGGQINIEAPTGNHDLVKEFLNDCEDCLRKLFPGKQPAEDRYAAAEGILALVTSEFPAGVPTFDDMQEALAYLVSDPRPQRPATPMLDKLRSVNAFTEKIQEFLEFMHEKGYRLKRHMEAGWTSPDGNERLCVSELADRGLECVTSRSQAWLGMKHDRDIYIPKELYEQIDAAVTAGVSDRQPLRDLVEEHAWRWDRSFELDDVGFEGNPLDKHLYECFGLDPQVIDDERRSLLDYMEEVNSCS